MIHDLKPYPEMRDSGIEWLGEVPEHWAVAPNRALFDEINERDHPDELMLSVTIGRGVIKQSSLLEGTSKKDSSNLDRSSYKFVQPGDITYNKMRAWQGAIGVSNHRGIVSPAYIVQRPRDCGLPTYFHHLFRTPLFAKEAERWSYGITSDMWSLRPEHFKLIRSCLPPMPEQAAIVRYLDHVDRPLQRLVLAKRRLIGLLTEQKHVVIHGAVSRGLDPEPSLKDSGVEWLDGVPEHWNVRPLKTFASLAGRIGFRGYSTSDLVSAGEGAITLSPSNLRSSGMNYAKCTYLSWPKYEESPEIQVHDGDILLVKTGATYGKTAVVSGLPEKATINPQLLVVKDIRANVTFMGWALASSYSKSQIETAVIGGTIPTISQSKIGRLRIACPPVDEQIEIVSWVTDAIEPIDSAISRAQREIQLLNEYRTRLIADVVTGKLDVRESAAALSEVEPIGPDDNDFTLGPGAELGSDDPAIDPDESGG